MYIYIYIYVYIYYIYIYFDILRFFTNLLRIDNETKSVKTIHNLIN